MAPLRASPSRVLAAPRLRRTPLALALPGALLALALAAGLTPPAQAQTPPPAGQARAFQVPAGDLDTALARFADQAGVTVLFQPDTVRGQRSAGLQGAYSVPDALRRLLDGTGLAAQERGSGTYVLSAPPGAAPQLAPVKVEGERVGTAPAWTRTTTRAELDDMQVRDWTDLGRRLDPGVSYNRDNGSINIRGLDRDRVVTRIDGIRLPWLDDGARGVKGGLNAVDFDTLSRLDIVRGADSASAGSGAMGGYAELRTLEPGDLLRDGRSFGALLKSEYDSADTSRSGNVALAGKLQENTSWLLQAGLRKGHELDNGAGHGGYGAERSEPDPEHYTQRNFLLKLQQRVDGGHRFGLTGEYFKREADSDTKWQQGPGTSYVLGGNQANEQVRRERVSLDYDYQGAGGLVDTARAVAYWTRVRLAEGQDGVRSRDARADIIPGDPLGYGFPTGPYGRSNSIQETLFGINGEVTRRFGGAAVSQLWTLGAEWVGNRTEQYSGGYDNCPDTPSALPPIFGPRSCDMLHTNQADMPPSRGSQWAVWLQDEIGFDEGRYTLTPALRYDHYEQKPRDTGGYAGNPNAGPLPPDSGGGRFSPRLLGTYKAAEQVTLYAQYAYGYKMPSATQLYTNYGGPGTYLRLGNPNLKPETSRGWELGARLGDEQLGGSVSVFDNRYQNFIDQDVPVGPGSPLYQDGWADQYPLGVTGAVNRARVRIYGAEAAMHWRFAPGWRTWGSVAWMLGKDQGTGQFLNSVPPLKATLGLGYGREQWGVDALLTAAAHRNKVEYPDASTPGAANPDFRAPGYGVTDLIAYWRPAAAKGLSLQAGVYNLFDRKYWEAISVPTAGSLALPRPVDWYTEPGRSVRVSLTYQY